MSKILIKLRKKLWLPFRWKWEYREKCMNSVLRPPHEIFEKEKRLKAKLKKTEKETETYNLITEQLKVLNWIRYGNET